MQSKNGLVFTLTAGIEVGWPTGGRLPSQTTLPHRRLVSPEASSQEVKVFGLQL